MLIDLVAAARPNFMKIAPLYSALKEQSWARPRIVHSGQHYDLNMSDVFFRDLGLPEPDIHLEVGSGTHGMQTGQVIIRYEKHLQEKRPDLVVVVGDVNSTMAATIAAVKLGIRVGHLEAGLRSGDRSMPEEINRIVTDSISDLLWTPSPDGDENLRSEGVPEEKIVRVGNVMIDSLEMLRDRIEQLRAWEESGVEPNKYAVVTLHRPSNVDVAEKLQTLSSVLSKIAERVPVVFPAHPRTKRRLKEAGLLNRLKGTGGLIFLEPLNYLRFMNLVFNAQLVITDSGGIQEETTYLGIPCLTLRPNTERPVTVTQGTNKLVTLGNIEENVKAALERKTRLTPSIPLWDGQTAQRVVESISKLR